MSETVKLIIEIPKEDMELIFKTSFVEDERTMFKQSPSDRQGTMMLFRLMDSVKDGVLLEMVKTEIRDSANHCECVPDGSCIRVDTVLEIIDKHIGKGERENIDSNVITHIFDGVTEIPKDPFKGWNTNELLERIKGRK